MLIPASTDLTGKVCLVTGAAGGIGLSTIEHLQCNGLSFNFHSKQARKGFRPLSAM